MNFNFSLIPHKILFFIYCSLVIGSSFFIVTNVKPFWTKVLFVGIVTYLLQWVARNFIMMYYLDTSDIYLLVYVALFFISADFVYSILSILSKRISFSKAMLNIGMTMFVIAVMCVIAIAAILVIGTIMLLCKSLLSL